MNTTLALWKHRVNLLAMLSICKLRPSSISASNATYLNSQVPYQRVKTIEKNVHSTKTNKDKKHQPQIRSRGIGMFVKQ